jgi:hypothetical protein
LDDKPNAGRRVLMLTVAVLLVGLSGYAGVVVARWLRTPVVADTPSVTFPNRAFEGWPKAKPDVVLLITGEQMGYLGPCGCSEPQVGGLERRYNLVQRMKRAGWSVVSVDLGDVPQATGPAGLPNLQGTIKYVYAMKAMERIGYAGVGFGRHEAGFGLLELISQYSLNHPKPPVVMTNLMEAEANFAGVPKPWHYADTPAGVRVGVATVVGVKIAKDIKALDRDPRFAVTGETLNNVLAQMNKGDVSLPVLLYQGPIGDPKTPDEARACAAEYPQFPIVVCLSVHEEPDITPTLVPTKAGGKTLLIQAGKKGKYVVVVGAWKTAKGFDFKYERVEMTPDYKTPDDQFAGHPIVKLMEEYTAELKNKEYLKKYIQRTHPLQALPEVKGLRNPGTPEYVGSLSCKSCHEDAYDVWKNSDHSHAYDTLVNKAKNPGNRQYDPECIVCHTVGFGFKTGYVDEATTPPPANPHKDRKPPNLHGVGCENCHGPGSVHVRNPNDVEWQKRMNPWRHLPVNRDEQLKAMDQMCQKCHDQENDVRWTDGGFKRKWPKVEHPSPKAP